MSLHEQFEKLEDKCEPESFGISFGWTAKGVGFGEFYFYRNKEGGLVCDNECMSKEFIKKMLCQMIDDCEMDCVSPKDEKS